MSRSKGIGGIAFVAAMVLALPAGGCLGVSPRKAQASWSYGCWRDMGRDIDELAGDSAIDCGLLLPWDSEATRWAIRRCAEDVYASGRAFKVGFRSFGDDSAYCGVAARSADGRIWSLYADSDVLHIGGGGTTLWASECRSLAITNVTNGGERFFELEGCVDAPGVAARFTRTSPAPAR